MLLIISLDDNILLDDDCHDHDILFPIYMGFDDRLLIYVISHLKDVKTLLDE
jgi:hypothetical protein